MFIHSTFRLENSSEKIAFMKQYSSATIITVNDNVPIATQLPFVVDNSSGKLILSSHFATANEQTKYMFILDGIFTIA
ncbi:FMN-binding negative transcriptional regulator [Sphingobacterium daejeonense]|uniref:FMN-binding negative transcriptional regulator n=1 Tax=Sphingobacterium daejeonense TaxID=371142 RepID=UPI003D3230CC